VGAGVAGEPQAVRTMDAKSKATTTTYNFFMYFFSSLKIRN
jgi:hypothetical protein